jgi:hypothetical protein
LGQFKENKVKFKNRIAVFALLLMFAAPAFATVINGTIVAGNQLTINGTGFSGTPLTVTCNGKNLAVVSNTATTIVATLNPLPAPGTYRLVVKAGTASANGYVAISAAPNIVAQLALTNQTASIQGTIITPTQNGLYRFSVAMLGIGNNCGPGGVGVGWSDDGGGRGANSTGGGAYEQNGIVSWYAIARANAGSPLSYATNYSGSCTSYELYITVEQLQ